MPLFDGLFSFLDNRSFGTIWFWLVFVGIWMSNAREIVGVPLHVLMAARKAQKADAPDGQEVLTLLDWLSLTLPHWQLGPREGAVILGVASFFLTALAILGFGYDLEMAQALTLLLVPLHILFWMRIRLARGISPLLKVGQTGIQPLTEISAEIIRRMIWHRRGFMLLVILSGMIAGLWAMLWSLMHPHGM